MRHAQPLVFSSSSSSYTTKALPEPPAPLTSVPWVLQHCPEAARPHG